MLRIETELISTKLEVQRQRLRWILECEGTLEVGMMLTTLLPPLAGMWSVLSVTAGILEMEMQDFHH